MEKTIKKNKSWIGVAIVVVVILLIVGGVAYEKMKPYLELKETVEELKDKDYSYTLDYKISGVDFVFGNNLLDGTIEGKKVKNIVQGSISIDEKKYLEVYANSDAQVLFNIKPVFEILLDAVEENAGNASAFKLLKLVLKDSYVSLEQIQSITGEEKVKSIENVEIFSKIFSNYNMKKVEKPKEVERDYLVEANYFQLDFDNSDIVLLIGIPKEENGKIYLKASQNNIELEVDAEYKVETMEDLTMPEETISDSTINGFKKIYELWKQFS